MNNAYPGRVSRVILNLSDTHPLTPLGAKTIIHLDGRRKRNCQNSCSFLDAYWSGEAALCCHISLGLQRALLPKPEKKKPKPDFCLSEASGGRIRTWKILPSIEYIFVILCKNFIHTMGTSFCVCEHISLLILAHIALRSDAPISCI